YLLPFIGYFCKCLCCLLPFCTVFQRFCFFYQRQFQLVILFLFYLYYFEMCPLLLVKDIFCGNQPAPQFFVLIMCCPSYRLPFVHQLAKQFGWCFPVFRCSIVFSHLHYFHLQVQVLQHVFFHLLLVLPLTFVKFI